VRYCLSSRNLLNSNNLKVGLSIPWECKDPAHTHKQTQKKQTGVIEGVLRPAISIKVPGGVTQRPGGKSTVIERYGVHICSVVVVFGGMLGGLLLKGGAMPEPWSSVADVRPFPY